MSAVTWTSSYDHARKEKTDLPGSESLFKVPRNWQDFNKQQAYAHTFGQLDMAGGLLPDQLGLTDMFNKKQKMIERRTTTSPWAPQIPYLRNLFGRAENLYAEGPGLPGPNPMEFAGNELMRSYAMGPMAESASRALASNAFLMNPDILSPDSNPYLRQYMDAVSGQILQGLTESALPAISGGAAATGNIGSSRQGIAEALATQRALREIGTATSGLASGAYGQGLQAMLQAQSLAPSIGAYGLAPAQTLRETGTFERGLETIPYANALQRLQDYQALITGNYGGTTVTREPAPKKGGLLGALGGASTGAGIASALGLSGPWGWAAVAAGALLGMMDE